MLKRLRKRKEDGVQSARRVADRVIVMSGDEPDKPTMTVDQQIRLAASHLGKLGGPKGGRARALALSPERRTEIARDAARKRWSKKKI